MSIADKAHDIASLDEYASQKLEKVLKLAELRMKQVLGQEKYAEYQALPDGVDKKEDLEYAEAYFALYYLAIALKKMQEDVIIQSREWGQGELRSAVVDEIIKMRDIYKDEAISVLNKYITPQSGGKSYRMYVV